MSALELLSRDFGSFAAVFAEQVKERADHPAVIHGDHVVSYAEFGAFTARIAAALQRDGAGHGDVVALCAGATTYAYVSAYVGALRSGATAAPLALSATPQSLAAMLADSGAKAFFLDSAAAEALATVPSRSGARRVAMDGSDAGAPLEAWLAPPGAEPAPFEPAPGDGFNIIYSSGTTGEPKGIIQPFSMRWAHLRRGVYPRGCVTMISTPLYSNTTLVSLLPTLANGGTLVLMPKFDAGEFLRLAERWRATHAMLVPVQYRRILEHPAFDSFDLSSFQMKYSTSAPFPADLKAETLRRWPGGLTEFYGMTEGGGTFMLLAHEHPDKLHTVGKPLPGHDIRLIGEDGREVATGEVGEVVGRSGAMMVGYHNQAGKTREAEWIGPDGARFIRTGDVGRFDADGFLTLLDRKKDMIISGGFNVFPSDLEAELAQHPAVLEAAVVGVASRRWGETPVAFVALKPGAAAEPDALREWVNARLGKTQRIADVQILDHLPRSAIGKVLKRDLRDGYAGPALD